MDRCPVEHDKKLVFSDARVIHLASMARVSRSRPRYDPMHPCRDQIAFSANSEARSLAAFVMLLRSRFPGQSCSNCRYFSGVGFCPIGGTRVWRADAVPCVEFNHLNKPKGAHDGKTVHAR